MSGMTVYFLRRLLLVPITFLVITFMVYAVLRFVPGGPIEQAETMMKLAAASGEAGGGGGGAGIENEAGLQLDESAMRELEEYYALDRSVFVGYLQWLGLWPRAKKHRVPPVQEKGRAELFASLRKASRAVADAEHELETLLDKRGLLLRQDRIVAPVGKEKVPEASRRALEDLDSVSFGRKYPLMTYFKQHDLGYDGRRFFKAAEAGGEAAGALEALHAARAALAEREARSGYTLDAQGKPMQLAFRPLLELNKVRAQATARIEALLGPKHEIVFEGKVYRPLAEEERAAPDRTAFFERAETYVAGGFGKRDDLLEYLSGRGYTWNRGHYYRLLPDAARAKDPARYRRVDALIAARHLANAELEKILDTYGFEVTREGRIYRVKNKLSGIFELDFGQSYTYNEPVLSLIGSKMEVSIQFGLIGYFLTWLVCVPLGVFKAIKHRTWFDSFSSVVVFLGYSIPGFVLCLILLATLAVHVDWIPLGGYKPPNIDQLGWWASVVGRARYMMIPVAGYMVGSFAAMTILMKNSLLENLGQDYVRTAFAKGLSEKRVIFVHALRNSLIPITAGIGNALGLLFAGSFLIEKTCNIDGMGLLGYNAIIQRDYPIILGLLVFGVLIRLFGNILSDIIWAAIDPRIRFGK